MRLNFQDSYNEALFVVHCIILPAILGCALASCFLRKWRGIRHSTLVAYNLAVLTTLASFALFIGLEARQASVQRVFYNDEAGFTATYRPIQILVVFAVGFDYIFRIATLIAVSLLAIAVADSPGRHHFLKIFIIVVSVLLAALTVTTFGLEGHFVDVITPLRGTDSSEDFQASAEGQAYWLPRKIYIGVAFFALYLVSVSAILAISIQSRNWPLRFALVQLLSITILATTSTSWSAKFYQDLFGGGYYENPDYYNSYYAFSYVEAILEVFLQAGLLMALLFVPQSFRHGEAAHTKV